MFTVRSTRAAHYAIVFTLAGLSPRAWADPIELERGKTIFLQACAGCHGDSGDGKGPAASSVVGPKPRDFINEQFKYGGTPQKLFKTVSKGIPNTAMPSWTSLPPWDRRAVIAYILTLGKTPKK